MKNPLIHRWPKVRSKKDGTQVVKGWYTEQWRYAVLHKLTRLGIGLFSFFLLVLAALPLLIAILDMIPEGTIWWGIMHELIWLRQAPAIATIEHLPWLAELLHINPNAAYSWKLAVAGIIVYRLAGLFTNQVAKLLALLLPFTVKRPVKVRIDQGRVRFWRWGWPRRYRRHPGVPVQFLCEQSQKPPHPFFGRNPAFLTIMRYGHRKIVVGSSMHQRDAERLALGLSHARDEADGAGNMQGTGDVSGLPADFGMPFGI